VGLFWLSGWHGWLGAASDFLVLSKLYNVIRCMFVTEYRHNEPHKQMADKDQMWSLLPKAWQYTVLVIVEWATLGAVFILRSWITRPKKYNGAWTYTLHRSHMLGTTGGQLKSPYALISKMPCNCTYRTWISTQNEHRPPVGYIHRRYRQIY
jgi:hypothetical protein